MLQVPGAGNPCRHVLVVLELDVLNDILADARGCTFI